MFKRWLDIEKSKSALLIGPRRSGKTTFLKQKFCNLNYITLDDLDAYDWAQKDPKGFMQSLGKKAIIDEIQRLPKLTIAVKNAVDNQGCLFYMTGSSSIGLLDAASDSLAGRVNFYHFPPACWGENSFTEPNKALFDNQKNIQQIKDAYRILPNVLKHGLFPEVITADDKEQILNNYKNTYFTRDILQLSNIENLEGMYALYHHLIRSIGSHLEVSNFARESGLSFPTAKKYLNALNQSELTFKLYGYQYGPAKRFLKASKTYFCDNGIIESFKVPLSEGPLIENFVISEIEKRRKLGLISADALYYYKSSAGREIDLLYEEDKVLHIIEIKATKSPGPKDIRNLLEFTKDLKTASYRLILFYLGDEYKSLNNVELVPIASLFG